MTNIPFVLFRLHEHLRLGEEYAMTRSEEIGIDEFRQSLVKRLTAANVTAKVKYATTKSKIKYSRVDLEKTDRIGRELLPKKTEFLSFDRPFDELLPYYLKLTEGNRIVRRLVTLTGVELKKYAHVV